MYVLFLLLLLLTNVSNRLLGTSDVMTTVIDGQNYFIVVRHSTEKWILMPCDIEDYAKELKFRGRKCGETPVQNVLFVKGSFVIKDLSELPEAVTYRTGFDVVEKGERKVMDAEDAS